MLSAPFFSKNWPDREYRALVALQTVILPIWHGVSYDEVVKYSPLLADIKALSSSDDFESVIEALVKKVRPELAKSLESSRGERTQPLDHRRGLSRETPFFTVTLGRAENERMRGAIKNCNGGVATNVRLRLPGLPSREWGSIDASDREELLYRWDSFAEGYDGLALLEFEDRYGKKWEQRSTVQTPLLPNSVDHEFKLAPFGPAAEIADYAPKDPWPFAEGDIPWFHTELGLLREPTGLVVDGNLANVAPMLAKNTLLELPCVGKRRFGDMGAGEVRKMRAQVSFPSPSVQISSGIGAIEFEDARQIYRQEASVEFPAANDLRDTYIVRQFAPPRVISFRTIKDQ